MTCWNDFDDAHWQRIQETWNAWWNGELERPLLVIESSLPGSGVSLETLSRHLTCYDPAYPAEAILDEVEQQVNGLDYLGDAFPKWWPNLGAGFLAALLGSPVEFNNGTTWFHPLSLQGLPVIDSELDENNPWFQRLVSLLQAAAQRWQGRLVLGQTDLGGNLDVLACLRGSQSLLMDLVTDAEQVQNISRQITNHWLKVFQVSKGLMPGGQRGYTCWASLWAPDDFYMLQCDISTMISPAMFKRFVVPDLETCCAAIAYPFYHLDGKGAIRHLDSLLSIEKLRGIQWVQGAGEPPAEEWLPLLEKIRNGGKLCQVYTSTQGALKITRALGGKGFLFCIGDSRLPTVQEGLACLEAFRSEGFLFPG